MPIQQKTKHLTEYDYKKIIPIDCEMVCLFDTTTVLSHINLLNTSLQSYHSPYWFWRGHQLLRPIFDYSRERKAYQIREYMVSIAKISAAQAREYLYKQELMKVHNGKLPEDIIDYIARYTWDILLLL